ncbi:MAG: O-antigen ligase family protein [Minisyncoccota bacterium]
MNKQILRGAILVGLFILPFVPLLVSASFFFPFITTKAFAFRIIVEIILGCYIMLAIVDPESRPKRSPILYAVLAFLFIVGLADMLGMAPLKSFWSNFERMEGYITMLHLGALFLVAGSVLDKKEWKWWWNTSLVVSAIMVFYCLFQLGGAIHINQGGVRVDGTLGNAAYLALYFLIHIFISLYYLVQSKTSGMKWAYGFLMFGQVMILYFTATRGAIFGLLGGLVIFALINVFNKENLKFRKWGIYFLIAIALFISGFYLMRNTQFVQSSPVLERFASISLSSLKTEGRAFIWPMALEGIKEQPLLGWGQENFNYVFAEHYSGKMFRLEPWFDRAHNIFLDWGIAAGVLGLISYLSLYVVLLIAIWKKDTSMSRVEKSVLIGLIAAYFFNNFFVFDNLVSYVLFFSLLAYLHARTGRAWSDNPKMFSDKSIMVASIPLAIVILLIVWFVNIKPIVANTNLIQALMKVQNPAGKLEVMDHLRIAYNASYLGRAETVEQISSMGVTLLSDESVPIESRNEYFLFAKDAVEKVTEDRPNDPRYEIMAGTFYSNFGLFDDALRHLSKAKELMPEKQVIHFNLGQLLYNMKDYSGALNEFKTAYEIAPEFDQAKELYERAQKEIPQ